MRTIELTQDQYTKVDESWFDILSKHKWFARKDSRTGRYCASMGLYLGKVNGKSGIAFGLVIVALMIFVSGCSGDKNKLTKEDVDLATCICQKKKESELDVVTKEPDLLRFRCTDNNVYIHYNESFTAGCNKEIK